MEQEKENKPVNYIAVVLVVMLFLALSMGATVAFLSFSKKGEREIKLKQIKLDTSINIVKDLSGVIGNTPVVNTAWFRKNSQGMNCFVRARIEYYSTDNYMSEEQENYLLILNAYDYSSKIATGAIGVNWLNGCDGYYYLVDDFGEFFKVENSTQYTFLASGEKLEFPLLPDNAAYPTYDTFIDGLYLNVEFQGLQSDELPSYDFDSIKELFRLQFPHDRISDRAVVKFKINGASLTISQIVNKGEVALKPSDPVKAGYTFGGWYIDKGFTSEFDFSKPVNYNVVLYPKWI